MPLDPALIPEPQNAVQQFEAHGGHLTLFSAFGRDPLEDREDLIKARELTTIFHKSYFVLYRISVGGNIHAALQSFSAHS